MCEVCNEKEEQNVCCSCNKKICKKCTKKMNKKELYCETCFKEFDDFEDDIDEDDDFDE